MTINVIKRDGTKEKLDINKIHKVLSWATEGLKNVSVSDIEMNAHLQLKDGINTNQIHKVIIESAVGLISERTPNYQYVASKLLNYFIRKEIFGAYSSKEMPHLYDVITKNVTVGVYDKVILEQYSKAEIDAINDYIHHERDFNFAYAGIQQMVDKYLLKNRVDNKTYETPQYAFIVIAMTVFGHYAKETRLEFIRKLYNQVSLMKINLPTPILSGVRTPLRQYSSCTLIDVGDSLDSIFASNTAVGYYTAKRAGIGLNIGRVRAIGSKVRNGEVVHTGVIPYLKMLEATMKCTSQNGIRGGSGSIFYPFWHLEVEDLLVLKNNKGNDENRIRKLDYGIQLSRLFYRRVKENKNITLFSPSDVPGLYEAFGDNDKFDALYEKYEASNIRKKAINARELMSRIAQERLETGRIYIMNIDHVNSHNSFEDKVSQSNLCLEICLPTTPMQHIDDPTAEIALCILAAVNLGQVSNLSDLEETCELIVRALDFVVEHQDYPVEAAKHMLGRRSLAVGFTNLAYYLAKNKVGYDSTAYKLIDDTTEALQYWLLVASNKLAKEQGKCKYFDRTKYSKGILPIDTYNKNLDKIYKKESYLYDWETLRKSIIEYGLRNSVVTAQMPCESSSVANNSTNGIEPPRSLISSKRSKQGILKQVVPEVNKIGHLYTTAFEMPDNKGYTELVAIMQKYMDQSISANHYYDFSKYDTKEIPLSVIINDIFYAYQLGVKTLYYANTNDGNVDNNDGCAGGACSV